MIDCPECWSQFDGPRCACGYTPRSFTIKKIDRSAEEKEFSKTVKQWLSDNHVKDLSSYRKRLASTPRVAETEPRLWAHEILALNRDGKDYPVHILNMAKEAIKGSHENV